MSTNKTEENNYTATTTSIGEITLLRRKFLRSIALGALATFTIEGLVACGDPSATVIPTEIPNTTTAAIQAATPPFDANGYINLGAVAALQKLTTPKKVDLYDNTGFVYFKERFYVFTDVCTHKGCHVSYDAADKEFECPCHGSQYQIDGEVKRGPAQNRLPLVEYKIENNNLLVKVR